MAALGHKATQSDLSAVFVTVAIGVSLSLRAHLDDTLPPGFPFLMFFPAVILTGSFAGLGAGIVMAAVGLGVSWHAVLPPVQSFQTPDQTLIAPGCYLFIVSTQLELLQAMRLTLIRLEEARNRSDRLALANKTMFHEGQHREANNLRWLPADFVPD